MKNHNNPILQGVKSRIRQLLEQFAETDCIKHNATKGSLREAYLKDFLAKFVPPTFGVNSGFITDCRGDEVSPQIDLLVFDRGRMPGFDMSNFVTIAPLEVAVKAIEVKSKLKAEHLNQIKAQQASVMKMRFALTARNCEVMSTNPCTGISTFVFSLATSCSEETLLSWFKDVPSLDAICVIGKHIILRDPKTSKPELIKADDDQIEILHFLARFHRDLEAYTPLTTTVQFEGHTFECHTDVGAYFTFDVPFPDSSDDD